MEMIQEFVRKYRTLLVGILMIVILVAIPTGYEDAVIYKENDRCVAKVKKTDESKVMSSGLIQSGEQECELELTSGRFKGRTVTGVNFLSGSLERDKIYSVGDRAFVLVSYEGDTIQSVTMSDHFRLDKEAILAFVFVILLVAFAGVRGFYAVLSFMISILAIWKILIPCYLKGFSPVWVGLAVSFILYMDLIADSYRQQVAPCWGFSPHAFLDYFSQSLFTFMVQ